MYDKGMIRMKGLEGLVVSLVKWDFTQSDTN